MRKKKAYDRVYFPAEVIQEAAEAFHLLLTDEQRARLDCYFTIRLGDEGWDYETEQEFFSDYRKGTEDAVYEERVEDYGLRVQIIGRAAHVEVRAPTRREIEAVYDIFEHHLPTSRLPSPQPEAPAVALTIFIGHGRSPQWRDLKDHLHDKHGYEVEAYEVGARAGHAIRDILEDMLRGSSFALLVLTAEDQDAEGNFRARQNVVHELGLFQGRLGFSRAIVLLEEGVEEFSNIQGIHQIRYSRGNIRETFGDVLATLKREFA